VTIAFGLIALTVNLSTFCFLLSAFYFLLSAFYTTCTANYNHAVPARRTLRGDRIVEVLARLKRMYPKAACTLNFQNAFELLIATMLSAQSTDARVNIVTRSLFRKYPTAEAMAVAGQVEMERQVRSTGFFRNKARNVIAASKALVERHAGKVPETMHELVALPGVGRKTANVVLGNAFNKPAGVVVDTHVARVSFRLGLTSHTDPVKIELDLMALVPQKEWTKFSHRMILHGREICVARKPKCAECRLNEFCPSARAEEE
jgi:endonuclease III